VEVESKLAIKLEKDAQNLDLVEKEL